MNAYQKRVSEQVLAWVRGESTHNRVDDECTPDFSCCVPSLFERDTEKRRQEAKAYFKKIGALIPPELKGN